MQFTYPLDYKQGILRDLPDNRPCKMALLLEAGGRTKNTWLILSFGNKTGSDIEVAHRQIKILAYFYSILHHHFLIKCNIYKFKRFAGPLFVSLPSVYPSSDAYNYAPFIFQEDEVTGITIGAFLSETKLRPPMSFSVMRPFS